MRLLFSVNVSGIILETIHHHDNETATKWWKEDETVKLVVDPTQEDTQWAERMTLQQFNEFKQITKAMRFINEHSQ